MNTSAIMGRQQFLMLRKGGINANMGLRIVRCTHVLPGLPRRILSRSISRGGSNAGLSLSDRNERALFSDMYVTLLVVREAGEDSGREANES